MTFPDYLAARLQMPFEWGVNDCINFAIGWVEIATGQDYLSQYRPWKTEKEALRIVRSLGGVEKLFDANLKRINPNFACDGDLALIDKTAYLFSGAQVVSVGKSGLVFRNRMEAVCAWSY